jgi:hypothetical protein
MERRWPLHCKDAPKVAINAFRDLVLKHEVLTEKMWDGLVGPFVCGAEMELLFQRAGYPHAASVKDADIEDADLVILLKKGLVEEIPRSEARAYMEVFTVPERGKIRRRRIDHPIWLNDVDESELKTLLAGHTLRFTSARDAKRPRKDSRTQQQ